ncbi:MAG: DUF933 domain-containing protein [Chloroflexi bacterium]|nr:DUF933 domain-containing protein [Chloroflexota bacterium]
MALNLGIVGLPGSGKTTLFNALTHGGARTSGQRRGTLEPNLGSVNVPDVRLEPLGDVLGSAKAVPLSINFIDLTIPRTGEHHGDDMSKQVIACLREADALVAVLRGFNDPTGLLPEADPRSDAHVLLAELQLADLSLVESLLEKRERAFRLGQKEYGREVEILKKVHACLSEGRAASDAGLHADEKEELKNYALLTLKPVIFVVTVPETGELEKTGRELAELKAIAIFGKLECDLCELSEEEAREFACEMGVEESCLPLIIRNCYERLNLVTFYTGNEKEVRAWAVPGETAALKAAGKVHTDLEKGFIKADVICADELIKLGGIAAAKEKGLLRSEGKEYIVKDRDLIRVKFSPPG